MVTQCRFLEGQSANLINHQIKTKAFKEAYIQDTCFLYILLHLPTYEALIVELISISITCCNDIYFQLVNVKFIWKIKLQSKHCQS